MLTIDIQHNTGRAEHSVYSASFISANEKIQMVDLIGQYEKIQQEIDKAVLDVIRSSAYINGPEVKARSRLSWNNTGAKHVINCANGTDALQIAGWRWTSSPAMMKSSPPISPMGNRRSHRVAQAQTSTGRCEPRYIHPDPAAVERAITPKTKAIVPVHLFGQ